MVAQRVICTRSRLTDIAQFSNIKTIGKIDKTLRQSSTAAGEAASYSRDSQHLKTLLYKVTRTPRDSPYVFGSVFASYPWAIEI